MTVLADREADLARAAAMLKRAWANRLPVLQLQPHVAVGTTLATGRKYRYTPGQEPGHDKPALEGVGVAHADGFAISEWWFTSLRSTERNETGTSSEDKFEVIVDHSIDDIESFDDDRDNQ